MIAFINHVRTQTSRVGSKGSLKALVAQQVGSHATVGVINLTRKDPDYSLVISPALARQKSPPSFHRVISWQIVPLEREN